MLGHAAIGMPCGLPYNWKRGILVAQTNPVRIDWITSTWTFNKFGRKFHNNYAEFLSHWVRCIEIPQADWWKEHYTFP